MDPKQQQALNNCHRNILSDLDIDKQFLLGLYIENVITEAQSKDIEAEISRRAKAAKLMEILPRRGPSCFPTFVNKLRRDYSWIASKLDTEYKKAQKEVPKEINNKLTDVINQLTPLVYGDDESSSLSQQGHPGHLVHQLSETVNTLQKRSYRALGISSKDSAISYLSLPQLIDRKVQSLQSSLSETKILLSEEKKKSRTSVEVDKKLGKEITKLKKELDKQKETNRKQETSIKSKNNKIQSLLRENAALDSANQDLQKEMCVYQTGAMITEWKM